MTLYKKCLTSPLDQPIIEAFDLSIILILRILQSKQQYKFP